MAKNPTRVEVDGHVVEIKPIERELESQSASYYITAAGERVPCAPDISYRQRSLYEVYVDDVMRGYVYFPNGWGGEWRALALRPRHFYDPAWHKHDYADIHEYGIASFYRHVSPGALNEPEDWGEHKRHWDSREEILRAFPRMVELGRCPSPEEFDANLAQDKIVWAERKRQDAIDKTRREQESAERDRKRATDAAAAEEARIEELEGLQSIYEGRDDLKLSNFQIHALERAIGRITK